MKKPTRGSHSVADVKANCRIDPLTGCWHWLGAANPSGLPIIYVFDPRVMDKRGLSGPLAMWLLAHGELPNGIVYRGCMCTDCLNPVHLRVARDKADLGRHIALSGVLKGRNLDALRANMRLAHEACGQTPVPDEVIREIRGISGCTGRAIAERFSLSPSVVSRIRRRESYREVV